MSAGVIERFGKYELIEKIASGGMAEVYRARSRGAAGFEKILVIKKKYKRLLIIVRLEKVVYNKIKYVEYGLFQHIS